MYCCFIAVLLLVSKILLLLDLSRFVLPTAVAGARNPRSLSPPHCRQSLKRMARGRKSQPVSPPAESGQPPEVSILHLERLYSRLEPVYLRMAEREASLDEFIEGRPKTDAKTCSTICNVDFAEPLMPMPDDSPLKTDSECNKFAILLWRMFSACESGSMGGDACRQADVLFAALNEVLHLR